MTDFDLDKAPSIGSMILHQLGQIDGKVSGLSANLDALAAENLRCDQDRDKLRGEINAIRNKQYWTLGIATGVGFFINKISSAIGFHI